MAVPHLHGVESRPAWAARYLGDDFFLLLLGGTTPASGRGVHPPLHPGLQEPGPDSTCGTRSATRWRSRGSPQHALAVAGVLERFPGLRILLAHGGGALYAGGCATPTRSGPTSFSALASDLSLRRFHYEQ